MVSLGKEIHKARIDKGWSQQHLAELTGLKQKHISTLERDKMIPTWPTMAALASELDLDLNTLAWEWYRMHRDTSHARQEATHAHD